MTNGRPKITPIAPGVPPNSKWTFSIFSGVVLVLPALAVEFRLELLLRVRRDGAIISVCEMASYIKDFFFDLSALVRSASPAPFWHFWSLNCTLIDFQ